MNQVVPIKESAKQLLRAETVESVLIKGDLSNLNSEQRGAYYLKVCESVGLNPLTKPFEYITLNNKLVLYALRACTDQLRSIHDVSVVDMAETERDGVIIVTAKVQNGSGRTDMAKGAVNIDKLKGEALANAIMKAETKAKRRATLSICGLGFLDETEVESIPAPNGSTLGKTAPITREIFSNLEAEIKAQNTVADLHAWGANEDNRARKSSLPTDWQPQISAIYMERMADLKKPKAPPITEIGQWLQWLEGQLAQFTSLRALEGYWNTTIETAMANGPVDEIDKDMAMATFARHQTRIEAAEAAK